LKGGECILTNKGLKQGRS